MYALGTVDHFMACHKGTPSHTQSPSLSTYNALSALILIYLAFLQIPHNPKTLPDFIFYGLYVTLMDGS